MVKKPFISDKDIITCPHCGYKITKPYPDDGGCPRCGKYVPAIKYKYQDNNEAEKFEKLPPKNFDTVSVTPSKKLGIKIRKNRDEDFELSDAMIPLQQNNEYLRFLGITTKEGRKKLFFSNKRFKYLLELANNLDYIATSILGGELDKMLLISEKNIEENNSKNVMEEKCQFLVKGNLIYVAFGVFPDKKGKWILEQMAKYFSELVRHKDVDDLLENERYDVERKFQGPANYIIREYKRLQEVFTDKEIPYLEDWLRIDYLGLSSMSIGVISLLLDEDENLDITLPGEFKDELEEFEMKESLLTAKIEAIAANTLGNTGSYPRWIAVKLGFQRYRFLTFKKYKNEYFLSLLSEGNLQKLDKVEDEIEPILLNGINT